jgi:hypothetical protein
VEHSVVEAKYLRVVFKRHNRIRNEKCDVNHPPILHPVTCPRGQGRAGCKGQVTDVLLTSEGTSTRSVAVIATRQLVLAASPP